MAVQDTNGIDLVVHDPKTDSAILCMVEVRDWGHRDALLPDLQQKFSTYLTYALDGQLLQDYPAMNGKLIRFELRTDFASTSREQQFMDIVIRDYLEPEGITFHWQLLGQAEQRT